MLCPSHSARKRRPPRHFKPGSGSIDEQHTFFQHNADIDTPGPNWRDPPPGYPAFDWLVHLDRLLISPTELLHVSAWKPHELTQEFINPAGTLRPFNHRAPCFDEDLAGPYQTLSYRLYRVLEFLTSDPLSLGLMSAGTTSPGPVVAGADQVVRPVAMIGLTTARSLAQTTDPSVAWLLA